MGTTSQKLTYLNTTKQLLKTEINKINNVLDDNSTFRSYPQELFNGYLDILNNGTDTLWNNLEKVSQTGTEAALEGVETAPMKMVPNGNTSQDTTSGKNLIAPNNLTETTVSGVTFTPIYDGKKLKYINVNGTSTSLISYDVSTIPLTLQAGTYFLSGCPTGGGNSTYELGLRYASFPRDLGNGVVLNLSAEATYSNCRIVIQNGVTVNNQKFYPMLEKGSTATPYEPYTGGQPSPSPDYPQEVKVVKGENVVSVQSKNMANFSILGKVPSVSNGELVNYGGAGCTELIEIDNTKEYVYTYETTSTPLGRYVFFYDENGNYIGSRSNTASGYKPNDETSWFPRTKYLRLRLDKMTAHTDIQLEQNSQATPYVPYSKTDYPISLGTLELCKINTYKDYFHKDNGKWYVHKEIGKVILDGSKTWRKDTGYFNCNASLGGIAGQGYTNYYKYGSLDTLNNFVITTNAFRVNADFETLEDYKNWLSTHNVILYYQLATPTEEEITNTTLIEQLEAISNAKSVKDKTYITQTNDELPFILDVEAIKEYEVN